VERVRAMKLGDPMSEDTTMGAIISGEQADRIMSFIESAKEEVSGIDLTPVLPLTQHSHQLVLLLTAYLYHVGSILACL